MTTTEPSPSVEGNQSGKPRVSPFWADLGGREPSEPLSPEQEEMLVAQGLGSRDLRIKVGRRQRARAKAAEDAKRFSPAQQAINRQGLAMALSELYAVQDSKREPTTEELAIRIARGYSTPLKEPSGEVVPDTGFIAYEQGADIPKRQRVQPTNPDQPALFDGEEVVVETVEPTGPYIDIEAFEAIFKALGAYKAVGHVEEDYDRLAEKHDNPGAKIDGMKARADYAIREAYPYFDRLLNVWLLQQQGYTTDQIGKKRQDMIKAFKAYADSTTSDQRKAYIQKLKETASSQSSPEVGK